MQNIVFFNEQGVPTKKVSAFQVDIDSKESLERVGIFVAQYRIIYKNAVQSLPDRIRSPFEIVPQVFMISQNDEWQDFNVFTSNGSTGFTKISLEISKEILWVRTMKFLIRIADKRFKL